MSIETLLIVFAFVMMVSMVFQVFIFWRLADSAEKLMGRLEKVSGDLEAEAREIVDRLEGIVASFENLRHVSEGVERRAHEINQMFGERARDVDQLVARLVEVASRQADKLDSVVTDTVEKFEETTAVIQQDIVRPVVEISSLVKGLKTGLEYLFSKKQLSSDQRYPEDELFI